MCLLPIGIRRAIVSFSLGDREPNYNCEFTFRLQFAKSDEFFLRHKKFLMSNELTYYWFYVDVAGTPLLSALCWFSKILCFCDVTFIELRLKIFHLSSCKFRRGKEANKVQQPQHRMPFMKGKAPIRRTLNYLNYGKLLLKNQIKVFSITYNIRGEHHAGAREFVFWNLPQIQFKNPHVQVVTLKDMTPSPFIRCFYGKNRPIINVGVNEIIFFLFPIENGKDLIIDIDGKTKEEILEHCLEVIGKSA